MAHVKCHIYSTKELIKLDKIVNKANSDVCDAQKKLGQLNAHTYTSKNNTKMALTNTGNFLITQ